MARTKPRILQIISGRDLNGVLTYCKFLAEHLVRDGYDLTVLCRQDCWLRSQSLPGVRFLASDLNRSICEFQRVKSWIREHKIELIHTHMSRAHLFGVILRAMTGVPVVATAHSCNFQPHWKLNDFVIANSQATLRYHRQVNWVSSRFSDAVYCFTDLTRFQTPSSHTAEKARRELRVGEDEYLVGVVGQVNPRKGQQYLFQALPTILDEVPHLRVALVGPYYDESPYVRRLRTLLLRNGLTERVVWVGPRDNVEDYVHAFDLCVVPSLNEPLGLVAVEALAAGKPVVASKIGGLPEIISHEETGLLVPRKDSRALGNAVVRLARDRAWASQLAARGRASVLERFEPLKLARKVEAIYDDVVFGKRSTMFSSRAVQSMQLSAQTKA